MVYILDILYLRNPVIRINYCFVLLESKLCTLWNLGFRMMYLKVHIYPMIYCTMYSMNPVFQNNVPGHQPGALLPQAPLHAFIQIHRFWGQLIRNTMFAQISDFSIFYEQKKLISNPYICTIQCRIDWP